MFFAENTGGICSNVPRNSPSAAAISHASGGSSACSPSCPCVVGVGGAAESHGRLVVLVAGREELRQPRGAADYQRQHAGGHRISVPVWPMRDRPARGGPRHDVVRGRAPACRRPARHRETRGEEFTSRRSPCKRRVRQSISSMSASARWVSVLTVAYTWSGHQCATSCFTVLHVDGAVVQELVPLAPASCSLMNMRWSGHDGVAAQRRRGRGLSQRGRRKPSALRARRRAGSRVLVAHALHEAGLPVWGMSRARSRSSRPRWPSSVLITISGPSGHDVEVVVGEQRWRSPDDPVFCAPGRGRSSPSPPRPCSRGCAAPSRVWPCGAYCGLVVGGRIGG